MEKLKNIIIYYKKNKIIYNKKEYIYYICNLYKIYKNYWIFKITNLIWIINLICDKKNILKFFKIEIEKINYLRNNEIKYELLINNNIDFNIYIYYNFFQLIRINNLKKNDKIVNNIIIRKNKYKKYIIYILNIILY